MKRGVRPISNSRDETVLNGIEVNVIHMPLEITLVANSVLPESALPQGHLAIWKACDRVSRSNNSIGKSTFDERQADRKVRISVRQRHHQVQMIGQHDYRINHEWMLSSRFDDGRPQTGNVVGERARRPVGQRRRNEKRPALKEISPVLNHDSTLTRISHCSIRATPNTPRHVP